MNPDENDMDLEDDSPEWTPSGRDGRDSREHRERGEGHDREEGRYRDKEDDKIVHQDFFNKFDDDFDDDDMLNVKR
ncbi:hypothetical protein HK098_001332 [Nowakowskiella sp. JEL0407]|nr:hypothetical protein HK098_001332 [Nowakowskiella sp. JEL0407]